MHDSLTGLANRVLYGDRVEHALARGERHRETVAVLLLDLDEFKAVNDNFGHAEGDVLLASAARRLRTCLRSADIVARLGGDEFAILLENSPDSARAARVAEKLIAALEEPFVLEQRSVTVEASVGVAIGVCGETGSDELLRSADVAMYRAKGEGKGRYVFFEPGMHTAALERLELKAELRQAVDREELSLCYQPIVDLSTGAITGLEALDLDFVRSVDETVKKARLDPRSLILEVTESSLMQRGSAALEKLMS